MNYLRLFLFLSWILSLSPLFAQSTDHVPGEIMVMLEPGTRLESLLSKPLPADSITYLEYHQSLVPGLRIHLVRFNPNLIEENVVLAYLRKHPGVMLAQFNHYIEQRKSQATTPNDPSFGGQWALHNTGQNGGTADADIDAPEAWDLATGNGLSSLGDTMVIAVIDGGADLAHSDLLFWKNHQEIPGNGIDDDQNGYIDDFDGWNAFTNSGILSTDLHGTEVAGVVAARGNNGIGISGLTWNTQVMPIEASASVESIVVAGYGYVYEMRKRYNESNGASGAFIVVANSSFGFNFGSPANFPLWCAMYDSLGQIGILSVGATTNGSVDVDVQGDIPSTCPSDYLIVVTNTTRNDQKLPAAGFGLTHVDLGAPGTDILTTSPGNNYNTDSGTSFAAPYVSGTIALMLEAACPDFIALYKDDPASMALVIRDLLLQGVDTLASLQGLTATSGRLNAFKSVMGMVNFCGELPACVPPFDVAVSGVTDSSAFMTWTATDSADSVILQYRPVGSGLWLSDTTNGPGLALTNLSSCTDYEVRLAAICGDSISDFSQLFLFSSEGCCDPPADILVVSVSNTTMLLSWGSVYAALSYELRHRESGSSIWLNLSPADTFLTLSGLLPCRAYEIQLATVCDTGLSVFSSSFLANSLGCGSCLDFTYCEAKGNDSGGEWIESIAAGPISNSSGDNNGYGNFTDNAPILETGISYPVELVPGHSGFAFNEYWRIWVDLNQDGDLTDPDELVFDSGDGFNDTVRGQLVLPNHALGGSTRMRIAMRFYSSFGGIPPEACGVFDFGEVEDYCVTIQPDTSCLPPTGLQIDSLGFNAVSISWNSTTPADSYVVRLLLPDGGIQNMSTSDTTFTWNGLMPCTDYILQIASICDMSMGALSDSLIFTTTGCDACLELPYCESMGENVQDEWIGSVQIDTFVNASGNNGGYGDFMSLSLRLRRGSSYPITLIPEFAGQAFGEYWQLRIDLNKDGDFEDAGELAYDSGMGISDTIAAQITIPGDASTGSTRLRISMRFDSAASACGPVDFGEVEDYCLDILNATGIDQPAALSDIRIFPNPARDQLAIASKLPIQAVSLWDLSGRMVLQPTVTVGESVQFSVRDLPAGLYVVRIARQDGVWVKRVWVE